MSTRTTRSKSRLVQQDTDVNSPAAVVAAGDPSDLPTKRADSRSKALASSFTTQTSSNNGSSIEEVPNEAVPIPPTNLSPPPDSSSQSASAPPMPTLTTFNQPRPTAGLSRLVANPVSKPAKPALPAYLAGMDVFPTQPADRQPADQSLVQLGSDRIDPGYQPAGITDCGLGAVVPQRPPEVWVDTSTIVADCDHLAAVFKQPASLLRLLYSNPFAFPAQAALPPPYPRAFTESFFQNNSMFPSLLSAFPWLANTFVVLFYLEFELIHQKLLKLGQIMHRQIELEIYQTHRSNTTHKRVSTFTPDGSTEQFVLPISEAPLLATSSLTPSTSHSSHHHHDHSSTHLRSVNPKQTQTNTNGPPLFAPAGQPGLVSFPVESLLAKVLNVDVQQSVFDLFLAYEAIAGDYQNIPKGLLTRGAASNQPTNGSNQSQNGTSTTALLENYPTLTQPQFLSVLCFLSNYCPDLFATTTMDPALHNIGVVDPAKLKTISAADTGFKFTLINPLLSSAQSAAGAGNQQIFGMRYLLFGWLGHDIATGLFPDDLLALPGRLSELDRANKASTGLTPVKKSRRSTELLQSFDDLDQTRSKRQRTGGPVVDTALSATSTATASAPAPAPAPTPEKISASASATPQHTQLFITVLTTLTTLFFTRVKITIGRIAFCLLTQQNSVLQHQISQKSHIPAALQDQISHLKAQIQLISPADPQAAATKAKIVGQMQQLVVNFKKITAFLHSLSNSVKKTSLQLPVLQQFVDATLYAPEYCKYTVPLLAEQQQNLYTTTPLTLCSQLAPGTPGQDHDQLDESGVPMGNHNDSLNESSGGLFGSLVLHAGFLPIPSSSAPSTPSSRIAQIYNTTPSSSNVSMMGTNGQANRYMDPQHNVFAPLFTRTFDQLFTKLTPLVLFPVHISFPFSSLNMDMDPNRRSGDCSQEDSQLSSNPPPSLLTSSPGRVQPPHLKPCSELLDTNTKDAYRYPEGITTATCPPRLFNLMAQSAAILPSFALTKPMPDEVDDIIRANQRVLLHERNQVLRGEPYGVVTAHNIPPTVLDLGLGTELIPDRDYGDNSGFHSGTIRKQMSPTDSGPNSSFSSTEDQPSVFTTPVHPRGRRKLVKAAGSTQSCSAISTAGTPTLTTSTAPFQFSVNFNQDATTKLLSMLILIILPPTEMTSPLHQLSISLREDLVRSLLPPLNYSADSLSHVLASSRPSTPSTPSSKSTPTTATATVDAASAPKPPPNLALWVPQVVSESLQSECFDKFTTYRLPNDSVLCLDDALTPSTSSASFASLSTRSNQSSRSQHQTPTSSAPASTPVTTPASTTSTSSRLGSLSSTPTSSHGSNRVPPAPPYNTVPVSDINFLSNHAKKSSDDTVPVSFEASRLARARLRRMEPTTPSSSMTTSRPQATPATPSKHHRVTTLHQSPRSRLRNMSPIRSTPQSSQSGSAFGTPSTSGSSRMGHGPPHSTAQKMVAAVMTVEQRQKMRGLKKDQELTLAAEIIKFEAMQSAVHWFGLLMAQINVAAKVAAGPGADTTQLSSSSTNSLASASSISSSSSSIPAPIQTRLAYLFHHLRQLSWFFYQNDKSSNYNIDWYARHRDHPHLNNHFPSTMDHPHLTHPNQSTTLDSSRTSMSDDVLVRAWADEENINPNLPQFYQKEGSQGSGPGSTSSGKTTETRPGALRNETAKTNTNTNPKAESTSTSSTASGTSASQLLSGFGLGTLDSNTAGTRAIHPEIPYLPHCSPLLLFATIAKALPAGYRAAPSEKGKRIAAIIGSSSEQQQAFLAHAQQFLASNPKHIINLTPVVPTVPPNGTTSLVDPKTQPAATPVFNLDYEILREEHYCAQFTGIGDIYEARRQEFWADHEHAVMDELGLDEESFDPAAIEYPPFPLVLPHILPTLATSTISGTGRGIDLATTLKTIHTDLDCLLATTRIHGAMARGNDTFSAPMTTVLTTSNVNSAYISPISIEYAIRFFPSNFTLFPNNELIWVKSPGIRAQITETLSVLGFLHALLDRATSIIVSSLSRAQIQLFRTAAGGDKTYGLTSAHRPATGAAAQFSQQQYRRIQSILGKSTESGAATELLTEREYCEYLTSYPRLSSSWWRFITHRHHSQQTAAQAHGFNSITAPAPGTSVGASGSSHATLSGSNTGPEQFMYQFRMYDHIFGGESDIGLNRAAFFSRYESRLERFVTAVAGSLSAPAEAQITPLEEQGEPTPASALALAIPSSIVTQQPLAGADSRAYSPASGHSSRLEPFSLDDAEESEQRSLFPSHHQLESQASFRLPVSSTVVPPPCSTSNHQVFNSTPRQAAILLDDGSSSDSGDDWCN